MKRGLVWISAITIIGLALIDGQPNQARGQSPESPIPDTTKAQPKAPLSLEPAPAPSVTNLPTDLPTSNTMPQPGGAFLLDRSRFTEILRVENPLIWPMIVCSIVAFGYFLDRWFSLRRSRIVPREFVNRFLDRLGTGKLDRDRAMDLCKANDSPAARVFSQVLMMWGEPAGQIRTAITQSIGMEYVLLRKNIRVLNATATLSPLLGLLGTVVGIIESFNSLGGKNVPSKSAALAEGIGLALVMTALGLVVAIFSVSAYYYLMGRLDAMMVSLEQESLRVMEVVAGSGNRSTPDRRSSQMEISRGIDSRIA
jgi:biopolymer transport protein ExbB